MHSITMTKEVQAPTSGALRQTGEVSLISSSQPERQPARSRRAKASGRGVQATSQGSGLPGMLFESFLSRIVADLAWGANDSGLSGSC